MTLNKLFALAALVVISSATSFADVDSPNPADPVSYIPYGSTLTVTGRIDIPPQQEVIRFRPTVSQTQPFLCWLTVKPDPNYRRYKIGTTFTISHIEPVPNANGVTAILAGKSSQSAQSVGCCELDLENEGGYCARKNGDLSTTMRIGQFKTSISDGFELFVARAIVIEH